jgi:hypothetical protein
MMYSRTKISIFAVFSFDKVVLNTGQSTLKKTLPTKLTSSLYIKCAAVLSSDGITLARLNEMRCILVRNQSFECLLDYNKVNLMLY